MQTILAAAVFLLAAASETAADTATPPEARPFTRAQSVVYSEVHGVGLLMDVFTPTANAKGIGIIDVVSGAWHSDKGKLRDHEQAQIYEIFCKRGFTVFAIRPGSVSRFTGPEMVAHVKRGVRYVKQHAQEYGIDPERLGMTGASAGGHLALMTLCTTEPANPAAEKEADRTGTELKAVGVFFPPTDFLNWNGEERVRGKGELFTLGGFTTQTDEEKRALMEAMSPARRAKQALPPVLLIHGDADDMVPLQQSEIMIEALKNAGGEAELIVKPGGGHPWLTIPEEVAKLADWFEQRLSE